MESHARAHSGRIRSWGDHRGLAQVGCRKCRARHFDGWDDDASRGVWLDKNDGALQALEEGTAGIECSTLSVPYVRELSGAFEAEGRILVDAPRAGSRPQAEAGQWIFFVGGTNELFERVAPVLQPMAGAVHHAGESGAGATVKLMVNALFGAQLGVIAELIGFARKAGIDPGVAVETIASTLVCSPAAKMSAAATIAGNRAPAFPIDLVAKDFALPGDSAKWYSAAVPLSLRIGDVYATGVRERNEGDNITGIAQLYTQAVA